MFDNPPMKDITPVDEQKKFGPPKGVRYGGRTKGTPNKVTKLLKDAILMAAETVGADGRGQNGVVGYCQRLAEHEPKAFAGLLAKVLPTQVTTEDDGPVVFTTVYQTIEGDTIKVQGDGP